MKTSWKQHVQTDVYILNLLIPFDMNYMYIYEYLAISTSPTLISMSK